MHTRGPDHGGRCVRLCSLAPLLALLLVVVGCGGAEATARLQRQPPKRHSPVALIAFVNDVHNRLEEEDPSTSTPCGPKARARGTCVGGWPRIATAVKSLRQQAAREGAAFWFLDVGDEFTGTNWDAVYRGQTVLPQLMNAVKPDAMTIGNHEFDFGPGMLGAFIGNLSFPMLGLCNADTSGEPALRDKLQKFVVLTHGPFKVGVLGWITPTTGVSAPDVGGVKFLPIVPAVTACLAELRQQHPDLDLVIGLSHSAYSDDLVTAQQVPGLDVIIGGHSHTFLFTPTSAGPIVAQGPGVNASTCLAMGACDKPFGPYPTYVSTGTPVVQAYYSSKYLGLIKVDLGRRGKGGRRPSLVPGVQPLLLGGRNSSNNVEQDPDLLQIIERYRAPVDALQTKVAGRTLVPLEGDPAISRTNETNLGSYLCDAFLRSVPGTIAAKAAGLPAVCIVNAGGIRTGFKGTGNITVGAALTMLPYANTVAFATVDGASLLAALQHGLTDFPAGGRFLQVAGVRYYFKSGTDAAPQFHGAVVVRPDGSTAPIAPSDKFLLVTLDYVLQGGDGFNFAGADVLQPTGTPYAQVFMEDLQRFPEGIAPTTHDRIIDCARFAFPGCPASRR